MSAEAAVLRDAMLALLANRDFLGYQLSHANGNLDDAQMDRIVEGYFERRPAPDAARRARVLHALLGDSLDSDVLSVMLDCGHDEATRLLAALRSDGAQENP